MKGWTSSEHVELEKMSSSMQNIATESCIFREIELLVQTRNRYIDSLGALEDAFFTLQRMGKSNKC